MSQTPQEPSMEEILASIRRIISEDKKPAAVKRPPSSGKLNASSEESDILDLQHPLSENESASRQGGYARGSLNTQIPSLKPTPKNSFLSEETIMASREAFNGLERKSPRESLGNKSLEEVVEYVLRPFLKEWLDSNLPTLVKQIVREQVERITRSKM